MSRKKIILLADDAPEILNALRRVISSCGEQINNREDLRELPPLEVEILTALCGHEALAAFRARGADLVVTDFNMPCGHPEETLNGLTLVEAIRTLNPNVGIRMVIQTSGVISNELRAKAASLNCLVREKEIEVLKDLILAAFEQWRFQAMIP